MASRPATVCPPARAVTAWIGRPIEIICSPSRAIGWEEWPAARVEFPSIRNSTPQIPSYAGIRTFSEDSDQSVQVYYDYVNRANVVAGRPDDTNIKTFDFDYKYHVKMTDRHDVVAGAGFRNYTTQADYWFTPQDFSFKIISYFIQDTITLREDFLYPDGGMQIRKR